MPPPLPITTRLATAHLAPSLLSAPQTTAIILRTITHASSHNASLLVFPESFLPGFPIWSALLPPASPLTSLLFARFARSSVYADGPEITAIRNAARENKISVSLGFSEKARWSEGTLWNSNVVIDELGKVRCLHRKLVPTFFERLSWGSGDGEGLRVVDVGVKGLQDAGAVEGEMAIVSSDGVDGSAKGFITSDLQEDQQQRMRIGALICGENTNPLARYAMMSQGQDIHISTWPAIWPTKMFSAPPNTTSSPGPTTDTDTVTTATPTAQGKNYNNLLANRIRAAAHCFEAKCYGIMSAAHLSETNITTLLSILSSDASITPSALADITHTLRSTSRAASMFLDPTGTPLPGFIFNEKGEREEREMLHEEEGVLFADVELGGDNMLEGKMVHDVTGGYQRGDVFELKVDRRRRGEGGVGVEAVRMGRPVEFVDA